VPSHIAAAHALSFEFVLAAHGVDFIPVRLPILLQLQLHISQNIRLADEHNSHIVKRQVYLVSRLPK
jgi:hypothetical protein